ncbi:MAG TPA: class I SAM-dependent methyltransferase [Desulfotomaculum sp.]|nr:class I SAM-dependent methyltransferase [Desulfotomaculum sp.]
MSGFKYDGTIDLRPGSAAAQVLVLVGKNKEVLEVGCATGYMSRVLVERNGCRVTGIELDPRGAEKAAAVCRRVICGDIESLDLPPELGPFEVIIFGDVLEHLRRPEETLRRVRPLLGEGGYVVASIPNITHLSVVLELIRGKFNYRKLGLLDDTHLRFFCRQTVDRLFRNAGYIITRWGRVAIPPELTEFQTDLELFPEELIDYLKKQNPDYETYQFVVRADKNGEQGSAGGQEGESEVAGAPPEEALLSGQWHNEAVAGLVERLRQRERVKDREVTRLKKALLEKEREIARLQRMVAELNKGDGY